MQERIELQQWDNESDPQLIKKMKDLSELYSSWLYVRLPSIIMC